MKIKDGFVLREMCGENIVAAEGIENINFNKLISLNESAAYLWRELIGKEFTTEEMAELLIVRYGIDKATSCANPYSRQSSLQASSPKT